MADKQDSQLFVSQSISVQVQEEAVPAGVAVADLGVALLGACYSS